jgi:hypothetical protein
MQKTKQHLNETGWGICLRLCTASEKDTEPFLGTLYCQELLGPHCTPCSTYKGVQAVILTHGGRQEQSPALFPSPLCTFSRLFTQDVLRVGLIVLKLRQGYTSGPLSRILFHVLNLLLKSWLASSSIRTFFSLLHCALGYNNFNNLVAKFNNKKCL